jgi:hypothetical protein
MLSLFDSITVPGLEKVTVYRDDDDAYRFYVMPSTPRLARDDDGELLLQLMIYARDVDSLPPDQLEAQRGWIAASVELRLTPAEEQTVRDHLRGLLEQQWHPWFLRLFGMEWGARREPVLTLPAEWISGVVTLSIPTPGGASTVATSKPSLISTNVATLAGDLGQDASELLRQAVLKGGLPMAVSYTDLTFVARIPSISVHIWGDRHAFMREQLKRFREEHRQENVTHIDAGFIDWTARDVRDSVEEHTTFEQFAEDHPEIHFEIDDADYRNDPQAAELRKSFEDMALKLFSDTVVPAMMSDLKTLLGSQSQGAPDPSKPETIPADGFEKHFDSTVDIRMSKSSVVTVAKNPNGALARDLTPEQITKAVQYLDLSDPYFRELFLRVHANVNFETDPVFGLKVNVVYDEQDEQMSRVVKGSSSMLFTSSDQIQTFRQILARGADGATKDGYAYWSEIIYKETGQTIRVPATGTLPGTGSELVISYRSLGFVKVVATLGPQPAEVASVRVAFRYPRSTAATGSQSFELNTKTPTATFFTYVGHPGEPDPYTYQLTYVLADGQQMDLPEQTSRSESLAIGSPFESRIATTFVAQADFTVVDKIILDATYADPTNDLTLTHHAELASNGASDSWSVALRDPTRTGYTYSVLVLYKNGSSESKGPFPGTLGTTMPVGVGATAALEVLVVPNLDAGSPPAVVQVAYDDAPSGVHQTQNLTLGPTDAPATFRVLLRDPNARTYRYRIQILGSATKPAWDSGWRESSDTVLLVRADSPLPAPPGPPPTPGPQPSSTAPASAVTPTTPNG